GGQREGFHHVARVGNLEAQDLLIGQGAAAQLLHPGGVVYQADVVVGGRLWRREVLVHGEAGTQQAVVQPAEFLGRKDVVAQVQVVAFVVDHAVRKHG